MSSFPSELNSVVADFHTKLSDVESALKPLLELQKKANNEKEEEGEPQRDPLDAAKIDLGAAFALNSLVWMWMKAGGENPKEAEVKDELDRVKTAMMRLKEIQDRAKRNKVDAKAAERFVKSGLWKPGQKKLRGGGSGRDEKEEPIAKKSKK